MTATGFDAIPPGIELVRALVGIEQSDGVSTLAIVTAWDRVITWATAQQDAAIVGHMGVTPSAQQVTVDARAIELIDTARCELASALRWSDQHTAARVEFARALATDLPGTRAAMLAGALSPAHARAIRDGAGRLVAPIEEFIDRAAVAAAAPIDSQDTGLTDLRRLRHELLAAYETRVVPFAATHTVPRAREQITRTINRLDPDGLSARRSLAQRTRSNVTVMHGDDGMSTITATVATELAVGCMRAINALVDERRASRSGSTPSPAIGAMRANAFTDLLLGSGAPTSGVAAPIGCRPHIAVDIVIDLPTLLGLQSGSAIIAGAGAIPAETVRQLLADDPAATLRRLVVSTQDGHLLEVGTDRYAITGRLREYLLARDQRCRYPDCGRLAVRADIDHALPWDHGGESTPANLGALCRYHHLRKTHAGYAITASAASGACTWVTPHGLRLEREAMPVTGPVPGCDDDVEQLRQQLLWVHEQLEVAYESACDPTALYAQRLALRERMDARDERRMAYALKRAARMGRLCTMLATSLEHHRTRSAPSECHTSGVAEMQSGAPAAIEAPPF